ncbi:hypothetical protein [Rhodococcus erythropolis]|uniref:hypothetical protein n=1 Tax=Rhodococcus erythropolis TaxID=1833 RepID=UPI00366BDF99
MVSANFDPALLVVAGTGGGARCVGQSLPKPVQHELWNYAADAEFNDDLPAAGVGLPDRLGGEEAN